VEQLPPGLRQSLYVKDDDYLQSFMHGNFITLTNLSGRDIEKIIKHRIEPLHISIHSMVPGVREKLFGNRNSMKAVEYFRQLDDAGIRTNIQIVLIPGLNDGKDLENTIETLAGRYKNIESVGIVPVGITRFNKNIDIRPVTENEAKQTLEIIERLKVRPGDIVSSITFLSDEFYLIAGTGLPIYESYGNFPQINNGIGKSADFLNDIKTGCEKYRDSILTKRKPERILIVTSEYGEKIIKEAVKIISSSYNRKNILIYKDISIDTFTVKNDFFGGNVKATGLLAGIDIKNKFSRLDTEDYTSILIPDSIFNTEGLTLDGFTKQSISSLEKNVKIIPEDGKSLMAVLNK
jgi:putative radical SAM enzyme (TIGR03279 family)